MEAKAVFAWVMDFLWHFGNNCPKKCEYQKTNSKLDRAQMNFKDYK